MKTQTLMERHARDIKGVIECFDRAVLFGTDKAIGWTGPWKRTCAGGARRSWSSIRPMPTNCASEVADHIRGLARAEGIEVRQVNAGERKEAIVEQILATRGRREGVVCILGAIERCRCFKVGKNHQSGFLQLQWAAGKCQHFLRLFYRCGVWPLPPAHPDLGALPPAVLLQWP